jgi:hypothetical protein
VDRALAAEEESRRDWRGENRARTRATYSVASVEWNPLQYFVQATANDVDDDVDTTTHAAGGASR